MWRLEASRIVEWSWRKTENCDTKLSTNFIHCAPKNWVNFSIILFFVSPLTFWRFRSLSAKQEEEEERERVGGRERAEPGEPFYYCTFAHAIIFGIFPFFCIIFLSVHFAPLFDFYSSLRPDALNYCPRRTLWTRPGYGCGYVYGPGKTNGGWRLGKLGGRLFGNYCIVFGACTDRSELPPHPVPRQTLCLLKRSLQTPYPSALFFFPLPASLSLSLSI